VAEPRQISIRVADDRKLALSQYQDLRRQGRVETAVVLCDMKDGAFQILGQGQTLEQIGATLMTAIRAVNEGLDQVRSGEARIPGAPPVAAEGGPSPLQFFPAATRRAGMLTLAAAWARIAQHFPPEAPQVQRNEMRKSFYAGCRATLDALAPTTTQDERQRMQRVYALGDEIDRFYAQLAEDEQAARAAQGGHA
jgi:hypothetical protein